MILFYKPTTQYENLGDALIAKNLLAILSLQGNVCVLTEGIPKGFIEIIKNNNCKNLSKIQFVILPFVYRLLRKEVSFVYKPGHLFGGDKEYGRGLKSIIKNLYINLLHYSGVKIIKTGVSVGPLEGGFLKAERNISEKAYIYGVREDYSLKFVTENSFKKYKRVSDLAFYSIVKNRKKYAGLDKDNICFSFRPFKNSTITLQEQAKILAEAIVRIAEANKISKIYNVTQVQTDLSFNNLIEEKLSEYNFNIGKYYYNINAESFNELGELYKNCKVILSNRLHSLLYAFEHGAHPIAIGNKVENFKVIHVLTDLNMKNIVVNIENDLLDEGELHEAINAQINSNNNWLADDLIRDFI
ncbi:polysaccharide pyruvyl transferase family protein [Raoultella ornithinolytica]|uniref:polysaccharide pyruvyl transferase family protein n=1 Tax=Raoultella ornithinolytica TaxID=54291 RepID=UPI002DE8AD76|nr:polysaccharide pyruvyl transferase family protein [Raoultella ornithinolytica]MEC5111101.1 polysaccharide pyruvyl transferase family protein [Raoultella ornithinolytica]